MKRGELIRKVRAASSSRGLGWELVRHGKEHEIWACGPVTVALPRHRELSPGVFADVRHKLEQVLGKDWWWK